MNILFVGDVFGRSGIDLFAKEIENLKNIYFPDFIIVNGENASPDGKGLSFNYADLFVSCGVDVITTGNHAFDNPDIRDLAADDYPVIVPVNHPGRRKEKTFLSVGKKRGRLCVFNLLGGAFMKNSGNPFAAFNDFLGSRHPGENIFLDFHAEATSEKKAMGFFSDGRIAAVVGTHTHVQTSDERILSNGTAYITDAGMTGVRDSVLGMEKENVIRNFLSGKNFHEMYPAEGSAELNGVFITINNSGLAEKIERVTVGE